MDEFNEENKLLFAFEIQQYRIVIREYSRFDYESPKEILQEEEDDTQFRQAFEEFDQEKTGAIDLN